MFPVLQGIFGGFPVECPVYTGEINEKNATELFSSLRSRILFRESLVGVWHNL